MRNRSIISFIHKYGVYYSISLFIVLLLHVGIYPFVIDFWLVLMCFCLNAYFFYHKGTVFGLLKQKDFIKFQKHLIKQWAKNTMKEIEKDKEDDRLN